VNRFSLFLSFWLTGSWRSIAASAHRKRRWRDAPCKRPRAGAGPISVCLSPTAIASTSIHPPPPSTFCSRSVPRMAARTWIGGCRLDTAIYLSLQERSVVLGRPLALPDRLFRKNPISPSSSGPHNQNCLFWSSSVFLIAMQTTACLPHPATGNSRC